MMDWLHFGKRSRPLEAIVFKPIYPPRNGLGNLTYFGGYPTLSKGLAWPLGRQTRQPITFLGQVELSKLPQVAERSALPSGGVLHFFGNNDDFAESSVLFSDGGSEQLVETPPPTNARNLYAKYPLNKKLAWALPAVSRPDAYPKWCMEPVACPTSPPADHEVNSKTFARVFPDQEATAVLSPFPEDNTIDLWIPDAAFPYLWIYIELWCNLLLTDGSYLHFTKDQKHEPGMARECGDWIKRAQSVGRLTRTTANDVAEFWNWVRSLDRRVKHALPGPAIADYGMHIVKGTATPADCAVLQNILKRPELVWRNALQTLPQQAAKVASGELGAKAAGDFLKWMNHVRELGGTQRLNETTQLTLREGTNLLLGYGHDVAGAIPGAAIEFNGKLHWPTVTRRHQMFGHQQSDYGSSSKRRLLMQFSSSNGMYWTWGDVGEFLFWITDDDLKHRRFDRALGEIESS